MNKLTLPKYKVEPHSLPSQGKFYPEGFSLYIRPYTFGEVEYLSQSDLHVKDYVEYILQGIECSFNKKLLTLFDFFFLSILRKLYTLGEEKYTIEYTCECGNLVSSTFHISDIEFEDLGQVPQKIELSYKGSLELLIKPVTLERFLSSGINTFDLKESQLLALHIYSMPYQEAYDFITNLPFNEVQELESIITQFYHSFKPIIVKCPNCGKIREIDLASDLEEIVKPFREPKRTSAFEILSK